MLQATNNNSIVTIAIEVLINITHKSFIISEIFMVSINLIIDAYKWSEPQLVKKLPCLRLSFCNVSNLFCTQNKST